MMTRVRTNSLLAAAAAVPLAALVISGCSSGSDSGSGNSSTPMASPAAPTAANGAAATIGVATSGNLGEIIVDSKGRSIYLFQKDTGTKSACFGQCATFWPPVRATGKPVAGTGLTASKLGTTPRSDGQPQVTYNGHPLYLYAADKNPGDVTGQGITAFGGGWFVLSPAGDVITATGSSPGATGNGY
jgi:predicted lipoprotein with Yx(FWY)xxD motif